MYLIIFWLRLDGWMVSKLGLYKRIKINRNVTVTEMAGFSNRDDVNETLEKVHQEVASIVNSYLKPGDRILDIGCGAGAYLKDYENEFDAFGIDIHEDMIAVGKTYCPNATFIHDDFLKTNLSMKFKFIFCIGALEFFPPTKLSVFFKKAYDLLEPGGILYLNYPHASSKKAIFFPDIYYIEYAPRYIERESFKNKFSILKHEHVFDGRKILTYDTKPYLPGTRTFKNGYNLIAIRNVD